MDYNQMCQAVTEMAENSMLILSDEDREFILGIHMMLEMQEKVPASYGERVARIYQAYQTNQHL